MTDQNTESKTEIEPDEASQKEKSFENLQPIQTLSRLKMRKQSLGFGAVQGLRRSELGRRSLIGLEFKRPYLVFEPTYQMEPLTRFHCSEVEKLINTVLDSVYDSHVYHFEATPLLAMSIANTIMRQTKAKLFNRYRILCITAIGQKRAQCYNNAISLLWDKFRDAYVDVQRDNHTSFIQITVFGIYLD